MTLTDFFDTYLNPGRLMDNKREYNAQMARVKALPEDYIFVFERIQRYMWMHASGNGKDILDLQYSVIELFEDGARSGRHVLDITGEDVAGFCDELLKNANTWIQSWPEKLNNDIKSRFGK